MEEKKCRIVALPRIVDPRGNLTVAEAHKQLPFAIKRAYWVYDVPGGESRGGHAHKQCREFMCSRRRVGSYCTLRICECPLMNSWGGDAYKVERMLRS
jgi:hypothetical protein